jgi:hypothetical protein
MTTPVPGYGTWYNLVFIGLLALAFVGFLLFKKVRDRQDMIWGSLFMLGAYFAACYGWSVQFFYWLAPFILICLPLWVTLSFKVLAWVEYPLFYGLYLARTQPDMVTSILGIPVAWTASLASVGIPGFWAVIVTRTVLILTLGVIAWKKIPVQVWQPIAGLAGALVSGLTSKTNTVLKRQEEQRDGNCDP